MSLSALCKVCLYYNAGDKTCVRSIVAVSQGKIHHNYAKFVRLVNYKVRQNREVVEAKDIEEILDSMYPGGSWRV